MLSINQKPHKKCRKLSTTLDFPCLATTEEAHENDCDLFEKDFPIH